jgi:hypothetical protein
MVVLDKTFLLPYADPERFVELQVRNVGQGTALDVEAWAWVEGAPPDVVADVGGRLLGFVSEAEGRIPTGEAKLRAKTIALAPGEGASLYVREGLRGVVDVGGSSVAVVFAAMRFQDLDGNWHYSPKASGEGKMAYVWRLARTEDRKPDLG